jgi:hypothetical protein
MEETTWTTKSEIKRSKILNEKEKLADVEKSTRVSSTSTTSPPTNVKKIYQS